MAVLCEGDPFFYGSFMYLFGRLAERFPVQVVPGVSLADRLRRAIGAAARRRNDVLTVIPGPLPAERLRDLLARTDAAAIMKLGRHFAKVRDVLNELGFSANRPAMSSAPPCRTSACCRCDEVDPDGVPYFSMVLVHRRGEAWSLPHTPPVFVVLSQTGLEVADGARTILPGAEIHGLAHRVTGADRDFTATLDHLRTLFQAGTPIIGVCAAGILIRALGPILSDKRAEPPVLALAEDGSAVVPLLGGHHGANDLARRLADALGIEPAITTAGDLSFGIALDEPPAGWTLANPADAKPFSAALLAGRHRTAGRQCPLAESLPSALSTPTPNWLSESPNARNPAPHRNSSTTLPS